jgi:hypothetical protein
MNKQIRPTAAQGFKCCDYWDDSGSFYCGKVGAP